VEGFLEKPKTHQELSQFETDPAWIASQGITAGNRTYLASMGIYLFNRDVLVEVLEKTIYQDFGNEVFPASIRAKHVQVHLFDGFWEDIGTIRAFYDANLELTSQQPPFRMDVADAPISLADDFFPPRASMEPT
jgi:glucose-1-phosphate adenylyltransferase